MDTVALVVELVDGGRRLLAHLIRENIPVTAACWVKPVEEDRWSLYIAMPLVDEKGAAKAYREVYRVLRSLGESWVTDSDIMLVGQHDPIAEDLLGIRKRFSGNFPTRSRRPQLGNLAVEETYIYPESAHDEGGPRQSFKINYSRNGETNEWEAVTKESEFVGQAKARGAVSYWTAHWAGERLADVQHATILVLLEVEPGLDESGIAGDPGLLRLLTKQANSLADEMFKRHHPDAVIIRDGAD